MSYKLFLDDIREPQDAILSESVQILSSEAGSKIIPCSEDPQKLLYVSNTSNDEWVIARSHDEFVGIIKRMGIPEMVSFDHDLNIAHMRHYIQNSDKDHINYNEIKLNGTGYHCAQAFLEEWKNAGKPLVKVYIHTANHIGEKYIKKELKEIIDDYNSRLECSTAVSAVAP